MTEAKIVKQGFLPVGYKVPDKKEQFLKFKEGETRIRFLSEPILGFIFFNKDNQPIRRDISEGDFTTYELEQMNAKRNDLGKFEGSRHFWATLVWSYKHNAPKILEITQISILKALYALCEDDEWGDPRDYDIKVQREGSGKNDTTFNVVTAPHSEVNNEIRQTVEELEKNNLIDLNALYRNEYPFQIYNY